jgi:hypothetical protein
VFERMTHATIKSQKPTVHAAHPYKNPANHKKLLDYLKQRLHTGKKARDERLPRMVRIDKALAGWIRLSDDDRLRQLKQDQTGIPQATEMNLPLNFVHIDDMMTYYAETFAPNRGMFYHTGDPNEQEASNTIVTLMNNHSIYAGYYRQTMHTILNTLKYNLGGFTINWSTDYGPKIQMTDEERVQVVSEEIWSGNRQEALDMYNTFWDPTVHPVMVHKDGEWAGRTYLRNHYWLAQRASTGIYFNCEEALENDNDQSYENCAYYRNPPAEAMLSIDESAGGSNGSTNWVSVLSGASEYMQRAGFELVEIMIRLNPKDFDLIDPRTKSTTPDQYETWRFTILNDKWIIETTRMTNIHGQIPYYFGLANDDIMGPSAKSPAEIIQPLQDFASHLLNFHVKANRKHLWGITWYDPTVVNYSKVPAGEVAGYVPFETTGYGKDVRAAVYKDTTTLETKQTMQDLSAVMEIVNQFFPTQALPSQIAGLDRAIDSQVAAVQQGTNRRQQKTAKLLDDSLFRPSRACMYYNIIQFQKDGAEVSDFTGKPITINLESLRATDLPFIIGQGLKAIDRMMIAGKLQQIIFALLQSQQAQGVDILALIDYWTSMMDVDINFKQFRLQPAQPAEGDPNAQPGTPEAGGEPAAGAPNVQRLIDPSKFTGAMGG